MVCSDTPLTFGQWVRNNRHDRLWTQESLAERTGYSVYMIRKIEADLARPSRYGLARIAQAFGIARADQAAFGRWATKAIPAPGARHEGAGTAPDGPGAAPPSLPAWPTPLIGRTTELATLSTLLAAAPGQLLTLIGPGGIGKTRMAVQAAATLAPRCADGVWFVDLAGIAQPADLLARIATVLAVPRAAGRAPGQQVAAYLGTRQSCLVLDNAEHLGAAAPHLAALLAAAPRLTIVVTNRQPLHLYGERLFVVPPLAVPPPAASPAEVEAAPAGRLFLERGQAVRPDFALSAALAPIVAAICIRLEGLPLAIELAAARLQILAPAALLACLDDPLAVLAGGAGDRPARQQSLRGSLDWSYHLLSPAEQTLFRGLAGGAARETLASLATTWNATGDPGARLLDLLTTLVTHGLLRLECTTSGETSVAMPTLVRAYAATLPTVPAAPPGRI